LTDHSENQLENVFDVDFEVKNIEASSDDWPQEAPPVVVFLLPGIRSDRGWAYVFTHRALSPTARTIIPEVITGPSDLGISDLTLRHRMKHFRSDYLNQITSAIDKHTSEYGRVEVVFVCHSMGSVIFSDIFKDIYNSHNKNKFEIKSIVFLGSIAKRTVNIKLGKNSKFINDVGQKDFWPIAAWFFNPWKYDPVGRFGFGRAMVTDRIFEENNHTLCTEIKHLEEWVLPIVEDGLVKKKVISSRKTPYNMYRMAHTIFWAAPPTFFAYILYAMIS
jgi:hypothetical protein